MNNEIIKFVNGDLQLDVTVSPDNETVWLTQKQMAELFDVKSQAITRHLKNIYNDEELFKEATCSKMEQVQIEGSRKITRKMDFYNLDAIIAVGYRVNSKKATSFRRWATSILKDYMIKGYVVNQKRLDVLNKTIQIQSRMLASTLGIEEKEVLNVVEAYSNALSLLDDYDHGCVSKPKGKNSIYQLTYEECRILIDSMGYGGFSSVFGVEKELGKLNGIIAAVYQNVFGTELYPSIEEKAANLLYFLIKDHPFVDGCKRIGASIFLEFLNKKELI